MSGLSIGFGQAGYQAGLTLQLEAQQLFQVWAEQTSKSFAVCNTGE